VYFPAVEERVAPVESTEGEDVLNGEETVLVCEDEEDVLRLTCGVLEDHGYRVLAAKTGAQALDLFEGSGGEVDLLLTDVIMPEMNGRQLANAIRARYPYVKVLFMTGYSADVLGALPDQAVLEDWISKPFNSKALLQRIRAVFKT
jgi:CheY-like chemotaxis protein